MTTFVKDVKPGMSIRQFGSEPFREVASVEFDGASNTRKNIVLFYRIAFVGGGAFTVAAHESLMVEP